MCSSTTDDEIRALALEIERTIAQNESVLAEYEEEQISFSEPEPSASVEMDTADVEELFS